MHRDLTCVLCLAFRVKFGNSASEMEPRFSVRVFDKRSAMPRRWVCFLKAERMSFQMHAVLVTTALHPHYLLMTESVNK